MLPYCNLAYIYNFHYTVLIVLIINNTSYCIWTMYIIFFLHFNYIDYLLITCIILFWLFLYPCGNGLVNGFMESEINWIELNCVAWLIANYVLLERLVFCPVPLKLWWKVKLSTSMSWSRSIAPLIFTSAPGEVDRSAYNTSSAILSCQHPPHPVFHWMEDVWASLEAIVSKIIWPWRETNPLSSHDTDWNLITPWHFVAIKMPQ